MFQVGDKIVHPMHGAGIVESIVQKKVNGVMRDYYVLKLRRPAPSLWKTEVQKKGVDKWERGGYNKPNKSISRNLRGR